ncbi:hypothetical protein CVH10_01520 [Halomonas sp. ND22Bw]|nr:hypothetical protein CVH10_01520 [Halomonas sp. ND22Bw]
MEWDGVKPGTTIEWRSETLPEGYLENDGWQGAPRQDYRRIFAAFGTTHGAGDGSTTFGMPEDRGEFKRGWDNGRGVDPGRSLAAHQWHAVERHIHALPTGTGIDGSGHWGVDDQYWQHTNSAGVNNTPSTGQTAGTYHDDDGDGSPSGTSWTPGNYADETRSRNNAVIYLTKI